MGWWIVFVVISAVALLGMTCRFKGEEALQQALESRTLGTSKGAQHTTPPDHADMSGWG